MPSSFWFVAAPNEASDILQWFRGLPQPPEETSTSTGYALYFRCFGRLALKEDGSIDTSRSPVVTVVSPGTRRQVLWSTGSLHFLPTPISQFPKLAKIRRSFTRWMEANPLVYNHAINAENPFAYYLEGSATNRGPLYGLPSGMTALSRGQYFVDALDNDLVLDRVCRLLRLRGVECAAE